MMCYITPKGQAGLLELYNANDSTRKGTKTLKGFGKWIEPILLKTTLEDWRYHYEVRFSQYHRKQVGLEFSHEYEIMNICAEVSRCWMLIDSKFAFNHFEACLDALGQGKLSLPKYLTSTTFQ